MPVVMLLKLDTHPGIYYDNVYYFYSTATKMQMRYVVYLTEYNEASALNEEQIASVDTQIQQLQLMISVFEHENMKELMKMSIEQMLVLYDEINWELVEAFMETLDDEEAPSPAFLAEVIQEFAHLLRVANGYDQEEFVDLALEILLLVLPEISEDVQLAIRTLAAQTLLAINNIFISAIEKINEDVIEKIFMLTTMDPNDDSKINQEELEAHFNPDFIILVAELYHEVLSDTLVSLIEELEKVFELAVQFYPEMAEFDLEEIKNVIYAINDGMVEIAGMEILSEGYYETEQIEKILEVMKSIQDFVTSFQLDFE